MKKKKNFCLHDEVYSPKDIITVLDMAVDDSCLRGNNKKQKFFDIPVCFDIETSSFYKSGDNYLSY